MNRMPTMSKSATTIDPIRPGEILKEEFLVPLGISASDLAKRLDVPTNRITRLINGQAAMTVETATLLSAALSTTPEFWMNLQLHYDLERAARDKALRARVQKIRPLTEAA